MYIYILLYTIIYDYILLYTITYITMMEIPMNTNHHPQCQTMQPMCWPDGKRNFESLSDER